MMDADTAQPIPTEEVRFGMRVVVIAMRVDPLMSSEEVLKEVGHQAFRLSDDVKYVPLGDFQGFSRTIVNISKYKHMVLKMVESLITSGGDSWEPFELGKDGAPGELDGDREPV
ncbi:hypothetical protein MAR_026920 [Mya arenaria]|uniref:S-Me-THD-like C-terminal domain-containing protein n=1 Tax=Mya arenaria TaxID=6604 RepID=A0ABY7ERY0_MYAAR|nr:hypothetical protein MAR_026920 [Mya arenaria]